VHWIWVKKVLGSTRGGGWRRFGRSFLGEDGIRDGNEDERQVRSERTGHQGKSRAGPYVMFVGLRKGKGDFFECMQLNRHAKRACKRQSLNFSCDR